MNPSNFTFPPTALEVYRQRIAPSLEGGTATLDEILTQAHTLEEENAATFDERREFCENYFHKVLNNYIRAQHLLSGELISAESLNTYVGKPLADKIDQAITHVATAITSSTYPIDPRRARLRLKAEKGAKKTHATACQLILKFLQLEQKHLEFMHRVAELQIQANSLNDLLSKVSDIEIQGNIASVTSFTLPEITMTEGMSLEGFEFIISSYPKIMKMMTLGEHEPLEPYRPMILELLQSRDPAFQEWGYKLLLYIDRTRTNEHLIQMRDTDVILVAVELNKAFGDEKAVEVCKAVAPALFALSHCWTEHSFELVNDPSPIYDWTPFAEQVRTLNATLISAHYLPHQRRLMEETKKIMRELLGSHPEHIPEGLKLDAYQPNRYINMRLGAWDAPTPQRLTSEGRFCIEAAPKVEETQSKKKRKKKKKKGKPKEPSARPDSPISVSSDPETIEIPRELSPKEQLFATMQKARPLISLNRVRRWQKLNSANQVRTFEGYQTEEKPAVTWLHHGFTPLIDKLITSEELRSKYAYKTERGFGLVAQIEKSGIMERGIIYYGINDEGLCYHRMFHPCNLNKFLNQDILTIAQEVENGVHDQGADETNPGKEPEDDFIGDTWELRERFGSLTFTDDKHKARIHICRLPNAG